MQVVHLLLALSTSVTQQAKTRFYESLKESLASLLPDAFDSLGK
jgi:hypothetical protein